MSRHNDAHTFFAALFYLALVLVLAGVASGGYALADAWWVMALLFGLGVAFTGASIRAGGGEAPPASIIPQPSHSLTVPGTEVKSVVAQDAPEAKKAAAKPKASASSDKPKASASSDKPKVSASSDKPDNLTRIEGIGPKMSKALIGQGVTSFAQLATMALDDIRATLEAGGQRFAPSAESWAEQASYAAKGDWDGLAALQDTLVSGRYPSKD